MTLRLSSVLLCLLATSAAAANPRLDFAFGVLAESRGDEDQALSRFEAARVADPTALPLVRRAVSARLDAGDVPGAVKLYRDLAATRPGELSIQLAYADFLEQHGQDDAAALKLSGGILDRALAKHPGSPGIIRRLFLRASKAGDKARQSKLLEMLSPKDSESAMLFASLAKSSMNSDDPKVRDSVDRYYQEATRENPTDQELARAASEHFRETGRLGESIEILKHHIEATPSSLALRTRLGILSFSDKRDTEGESALKEVLAIHPKMALAHQSLAKFYRLGNHPEEARLHSGELLKIRGGSPDEFLSLSEEWLQADQPRQARLLLERAVFDHPRNGLLADKLAIATRRDPETRSQASRLFREAEATHAADYKPDPAFLIESAESLIAEGQGKAAEERLRTAIKSYAPGAKKETASALRRLALLWETENRNIDAAKSLRQRADGLER